MLQSCGHDSEGGVIVTTFLIFPILFLHFPCLRLLDYSHSTAIGPTQPHINIATLESASTATQAWLTHAPWRDIFAIGCA